MQFSIISVVTIAVAAISMAMPTQQGATSNNADRRQSGNIGLGQPCSSRDDCVGTLNCVFGGGRTVCSRNRDPGQPCAQNAVSC